MHFIPHPLVALNDKEVKTWLENFPKQPESIKDYIKHSVNPRWAACHLIYAIAEGLSSSNEKQAIALRNIATILSSDSTVDQDDRVL